jgi:hypothetical protein
MKINEVKIENNIYKRMDFKEIQNLKVGDKVAICLYCDSDLNVEFVNAMVVRPLYWNNDCDEPDWELETTNGFTDIYSVWKITECS